MSLSRRGFLGYAARIAVSAATLETLLAACTQPSTSNEAPTSGGNCAVNGARVTIGANHHHSAPEITGDDVARGGEQAFWLGPSAGFYPQHVHHFIVTPAHFALLKAGTGITLNTEKDNSGHIHSITVNCR